MNNTTRNDAVGTRRPVAALALGLCLAGAMAHAPANAQVSNAESASASASASLSAKQQAIVPIGAFAAAGDMPRLNAALNQGLDANLTVNDAKEILVQVYAYAGFPRSLNALGELMKVLDARKQRGVQDVTGDTPGRPIPKGDALLASGTANQTRLAGSPVIGPLFEFAPAIDQYLKVHLFGAIFERDNLDWQSRELATLGMLSALPGAESQLQSHMRISMNVGLTSAQLRHLAQVLADRVDAEHARRAQEALTRHLDCWRADTTTQCPVDPFPSAYSEANQSIPKFNGLRRTAVTLAPTDQLVGGHEISPWTPFKPMDKVEGMAEPCRGPAV